MNLLELSNVIIQIMKFLKYKNLTTNESSSNLPHEETRCFPRESNAATPFYDKKYDDKNKSYQEKFSYSFRE